MEELDPAWFAEHVTRARDLAGERCTPDPCVPLEIAHRFAALVRSPAFWTRVDAALRTGGIPRKTRIPMTMRGLPVTPQA